MKRNRLILFLSVVTLFFAFTGCAGSKTSAFKEICDNGTDDDGDGFIDCADTDCFSFSACGQGNKEIMCTDGMDNDGDGLIDCADPDCAASTACNSSGKELICTDGADNDHDGLIDCTDPDCASNAACSSTDREIICTDGVDNDNDGLTDCADADCASASACSGGDTEICTDGVDNDSDGAIDCADLDCIGQTGPGGITCQQQEAGCDDGGDNDGDGLVDCDDPDCASFALCNNQCTEDTIYYSSPPSCPSGYLCGLNPSNEAECIESAAFAGSFYGACGSGGECPFGSICAGNPSVCMPFCKYENNTLTHDCPDNGLCFYTLTDTTINLCQGVSNCDLVDSHDCATDEGCFEDSGYTYCLPDSVGTVPRGDDCTNGICEAGNICLNLGYANKCYKYCDYPGGYCPVGQQCYDGSSIQDFPAGYGYCDSVSK